MSKPEQIGNSRKFVNGAWHAIKKATARLRRRRDRQQTDPDRPKPAKDYKGWFA